MSSDAMLYLLLMLRHSCLNLWPSRQSNPKRLAFLLATNFFRCRKNEIHTSEKLRLRCESNFHWVGAKSDNRFRCCIFCSSLFLRAEDIFECATAAHHIHAVHIPTQCDHFGCCSNRQPFQYTKTKSKEKTTNAWKNQLALWKLWCSAPKSTTHSGDKRQRWRHWSTYKHNQTHSQDI